MTVVSIARGIVLALEMLLALPLAYLLALAIGAAIGAWRNAVARRRHSVARDKPTSMFAILVPAHNEEQLIGATIRSLSQLDYPSDRHAVHIIADNCTDRTAEIARAAGVQVLERTNTSERGKGHALAWAFERLMHGETHYDAYVVLDADTVVEPSLLSALSRGLSRGALALQSHNAVLNAAESETTALRWLALSLMNYIRPLGRNTLGGSSTLTGNGMCLTHEMLTRHPWQAFGLSEDYQYYLLAVADGARVLFVPDANVRSVMPTTARQLQSQDIRWETLSPDSSAWQRRIAWRLFGEGIRRLSWVRLDALAELLTPQLSVLMGSCAILFAAAVILGAPLQIIFAATLVGALLIYASSAFVLLRPPWGVYRGLIYAPAYVVRKLWVVLVLRRLRKNTTTWVRTTRTA